MTEHLLSREPLFHHLEFIWDEASFEAEVAPDFHEITASGLCYERETIKEIVLGRFEGAHPLSLVDDYRIEHTDVRSLTSDLVQVMYTLHGQGRVTRRSTIYRRSTSWQAVFHQGTVVVQPAPEPRPSTHANTGDG